MAVNKVLLKAVHHLQPVDQVLFNLQNPVLVLYHPVHPVEFLQPVLVLVPEPQQPVPVLVLVFNKSANHYLRLLRKLIVN